MFWDGLVALNATTGSLIWIGNAGTGPGSSPAVVNGVVYVHSQGGYVYAINASTGANIWTYSEGTTAGMQNATPSGISSPDVANDIVYVNGFGYNHSWSTYALNASTGTLLWSTSTGNMDSSPAFANGVVYVGSYSGTYALNASTGAIIWKSGEVLNSDQHYEMSSPAIANGILYIGSNEGKIYAIGKPLTNQTSNDWPMFHHDPAHTGTATSEGPLTNQTTWIAEGTATSSPAVMDGVVYAGFDAFNATTGAKLWTFTDSYNVSGTQYSPAIANGIAYVCTLNPHPAVMPSDDLYALNATTGAQLWNYTIYSSVAMMGNSWVYTSPNFSPVVSSGVVYAGSLALNASTGALLWNNQIGYYAVSSPAIVNGVDYISVHFGGFYALNASTGETIWRINADAQGSSPAISDGVIYIHEDGIDQALNASTGINLWTFSEGSIGNFPPDYQYPPSGTSSPAIANGVMYISGILGVGAGLPITYALNASTGTLLWNSNVGGYSSPAISGGTVYVGSSDGIYSLNSSTGTTIWQYNTGNYVFSSPAVANGMVYVGSNSGTIYAFGSPSTNPSPTPTATPTSTPSPTPTPSPSPSPSPPPTISTTPTPTPVPTPTSSPTTSPTPTTTPTTTPTPSPSPTPSPTTSPTSSPSPTPAPTATPTTSPTSAPTTAPVVTLAPTTAPTSVPTVMPTTPPTASPTPTAKPTGTPSSNPISTSDIPQGAIYGIVAAVAIMVIVSVVLALRKIRKSRR